MGIRFACNLCEHPLNIKRELAGKIGVCPQCGGRIRIPLDDAPRSQPLNTLSTKAGSTTEQNPYAPTGTLATSLEGSATLDTLDSDKPMSRSPLDEPGAQWFVRPPAGGQYGPASGEVLRSWIAENRVTASTLIWRDGWSQWRSARETLPEFADHSRPQDPLHNGNDSNGLFDDPLMAASHPPAQPIAGMLTDSASLGQQRSSRSQRRMVLMIALAVLSVFLILTLVVIAMRS
jgi:hypothetical protein